METLQTFVEPWAVYYADHPNVSTAVIALHILAMFVGGGVAIATDRAIWRAVAGSADAARAILADLSSTHTVVQRALVVAFVTGAALFASDVATFAGSAVYWTKMVGIAALLVNGRRMQTHEQLVVNSLDGVAAGATPHTATMPVPTTVPVTHWHRVRQSADVSMVLWLTIVVLGVVLSNS